MGNEDNSVSGSNSEYADETDKRRDAHDAAGEKNGQYSADQSQGEISQDEERGAGGVECFKQKKKDHHDCDATVAQDNPRGLLLAFKLSAVFNEITRRQIDLFCDFLLCLSDHASQVSTRHVRLHDDPPLDPLAIDEIRPILKTNLGYLTERHLNTIVSINENAFHRLGITAGGFVEPDKEVKALLTFDHLRDVFPIESKLGGFQYIS